uniref:hypothetical protein n=1 Tax=Alistipes shahii TaxID=328814 RepID=UPI003FEDD9EB
SNMCSKVLNGHIILTDTSITTILAPEMTYTPKYTRHDQDMLTQVGFVIGMVLPGEFFFQRVYAPVNIHKQIKAFHHSRS